MMATRMLPALLLIVQLAQSDRLQMVVFPLKSKSDSEVTHWVGYAFPELVARKGVISESIRVWDPVFLFHQDSTSVIGGKDSLINAHRNRWQWDVALGGKYSVNRDSVSVELEVLQFRGKDVPERTELNQSGDLNELEEILSGLLFRIYTLLDLPVSTYDSIRKISDRVSVMAYQTYIAGYGLEMQRNYEGAITAYHRTIELERHFERALCRLGNLYLQSEKLSRAQPLFSELSLKTDDPVTVADVANFYVESRQYKDARRFIASQWQILEKSAYGLKVAGKMYLADGEYQRAISLFMKAIAAGVSDLEVELNLGLAYLFTADYNRATELFNRLIRFRPDYYRYYCCLGAAHRRAGRLMESCRVLETALKKEPDNATILNELATTYIELKWNNKAIQLLLLALEKSPQLHDTYVNLAVAYWSAGQKQESYKWLEEARHFVHLRQSVFLNYGNILFSEGMERSAIRMYKKAIKSGEKNIILYQNLARVYENSGKLNKACHYYRECLELSPNHTGLLTKLAGTSEMIGQYSEAENYYQKILDISPYQKTVLNRYVELLIREGKLEEAVKPIENYLFHIPSDKECMLQLAEIYLKMQWYEVALMKFQAVIRDFPENAEGYLGAGRSIIEMIQNKGTGKYEDAIYVLKQAVTLAPQDIRADILIGDIYMQYKGYPELAVDHWKKALLKAKDPTRRKEIEERINNAGM